MTDLETQQAKDLIKAQGHFFINWSTIDCDGVHAMGSSRCTSIYDALQFFAGAADWVEGPFDYKIQDFEQESGTWGQGWGIN